jgi:hypothetical protein
MERERELKSKFAEELLKQGNAPDAAYQAAFITMGSVGLALQVAGSWCTDPFVLEEKLRLLKENGVRSYLPTKEQQAADIYKMALDQKLDEEIRLKAHRLYAEIMGNIEKPAQPSAGLNLFATNVMVVKDLGTTPDWEQKAVEQQHKLIHAPN